MAARDVDNCACFILTLSLPGDDSCGTETPEIVKAKIYFKRESSQQVEEMLKQLQVHCTVLMSRISTKPELLYPRSLLNLDAVFDGDPSTCLTVMNYVDVQFGTIRLPIIMIEVIDKLTFGRVTALSGGLKSDEESDCYEEWMPSWSENLQHAVKSKCGSLVSVLYPNPRVVLDENDSGNNCDILRFYFQLRVSEIYKFDCISVDGLQLHVFNSSSQIIRPPRLSEEFISQPLPCRKPVLPIEIWLRIIDLTNCRLSVLAALSGTCKEWRRLFSHPCFWSSLDLKPLAVQFPHATAEFLNFIFQRCSHTLRHLRLSWLPTWPKCMDLTAFLGQFKPGSLVTFIAENCFALDDELLINLLENQSNIEFLRLYGCPGISGEGYKHIETLKNLRRLSLGSADEIDTDTLRPLITRKWEKLESFELSDLPATFSIFPTSNLNSQLTDMLLEGPHSFSKLRALNVDLNCCDFSDFSVSKKVSFLRQFLSSCSRIEELFLCQDDGLEADIFVEAIIGVPFSCSLAKLCPNLRRISTLVYAMNTAKAKIDGLPFFEALSKCFAGTHKLERLTIVYDDRGYAGEVGEKWDLRVLLNKLPNLRKLVVWKDDLAESRDEIEAVRRKFPNCKVDVRFSIRYSHHLEPVNACPCGNDADNCPENSYRPELEFRSTRKRHHSSEETDEETTEQVENFFVIY